MGISLLIFYYIYYTFLLSKKLATLSAYYILCYFNPYDSSVILNTIKYSIKLSIIATVSTLSLNDFKKLFLMLLISGF